MRVGADGDGIAALPDGTPLFVPFTLPDEVAEVRPVAQHGTGWVAVADRVLTESPQHVAPVCPHFGSCGGCSVQHWRDDGYRD